MTYDVAIAGLGGIGSAIAAQGATRGASVIGIEQFGPAHDLGSSHGKSRMIRTAYFEDPAYVPLVLRAYELWRELERATGEDLLRITGVLSVGPESSDIIRGARRAAAEHDLPVELLSQQDVRTRYPTLELWKDEVALLENDAGVLDPDRAVCAHLKFSEASGAEIRFGGAMESWHATDHGFEIRLADGTQILARKLALG